MSLDPSINKTQHPQSVSTSFWGIEPISATQLPSGVREAINEARRLFEPLNTQVTKLWSEVDDILFSVRNRIDSATSRICDRDIDALEDWCEANQYLENEVMALTLESGQVAKLRQLSREINDVELATRSRIKQCTSEFVQLDGLDQIKLEQLVELTDDQLARYFESPARSSNYADPIFQLMQIDPKANPMDLLTGLDALLNSLGDQTQPRFPAPNSTQEHAAQLIAESRVMLEHRTELPFHAQHRLYQVLHAVTRCCGKRDWAPRFSWTNMDAGSLTRLNEAHVDSLMNDLNSGAIGGDVDLAGATLSSGARQILIDPDLDHRQHLVVNYIHKVLISENVAVFVLPGDVGRITSRWSLVSYGTGNVDPETARSLIEHVGLEILPSLQAKYEKKVVVDLADFGAILETLEEVPLELYECESAQVCFIRSPFTGDALMAIFRFGSSETLEKMTQEPIDSDFETGPTTALTIFCDAIGEFLLKGDQLSVSDAVGPVVDFAYKKIQRFTIADFGIIGRDIIWPPMDADGDGISEN